MELLVHLLGQDAVVMQLHSLVGGDSMVRSIQSLARMETSMWEVLIQVR